MADLLKSGPCIDSLGEEEAGFLSGGCFLRYWDGLNVKMGYAPVFLLNVTNATIVLLRWREKCAHERPLYGFCVVAFVARYTSKILF